MTKYLKHPLLLLIVALLVFSCNRDNGDDNGNIPGGLDCEISWTIDGQEFSEPVIACLYDGETMNIGSIGVDDAQVQVDPISSTGTYELDLGSGVTVFIALRLEDGTQIAAKEATVEVTTINGNRASGTFSGIFLDVMDINQTTEYVVTDGKFEANF